MTIISDKCAGMIISGIAKSELKTAKKCYITVKGHRQKRNGIRKGKICR